MVLESTLMRSHACVSSELQAESPWKWLQFSRESEESTAIPGN